MLKDIVEVEPLDGYKLRLRFEDSVEGVIDLSKTIEFRGIFAPLADVAYFNQVSVNPELGTITWPNEADLDADVLYALVRGEPIPSYAPSPNAVER